MMTSLALGSQTALTLKERKKIKMLSVNQMLVYHTVAEAYNITNKKASDQLQKKFMHEGKHSERSAANNEMYIPEKPLKRCTGFSYRISLINVLPYIMSSLE